MKHWYEIKAQAEGGIEIRLYDDIGGWGVTAKDFIEALKSVDDGTSPITVAIHSNGGSVFDGMVIYNALRRLGGRVTARIDGLALSIASVIAVAARKVVMPENAMLMIHNPYGFVVGDSEEMRSAADLFDKARESMVRCYKAKAQNLDESRIVEMMDDETWITARDAVEMGLADEIESPVAIHASASMRESLARMRHAPQEMLALEQQDVEPEAEVQEEETAPPADEMRAQLKEEILSEIRADQVQASAIAARTAAIVLACVNAGAGAVAQDVVKDFDLRDEAKFSEELKRIEGIGGLCAIAKKPELSGEYIKSGLTIEAVKASLYDKTLPVQHDIDNKEPVAKKEKAGKEINTTQIYAKRKAKKGEVK
ncbi:MAG: Clp protease ClpP [Burkholderiales bacterium]|jgi:ATP-dependent protease ClpP protease subunit|nr:Clp protease ClpP [Burkholderiales bacterium]